MNDEIGFGRRRFLAGAATAIGALPFGMTSSVQGQSLTGAVASFGTLKQVDAGVLSVAYAEAGPLGGPSVIPLHGWPYDIHRFDLGRLRSHEIGVFS